MEVQTERWQLRSGTWDRDPETENWRLAANAHGTAASDRLSTEDVGHMIGACRDTETGDWLPPDFSYSPRSGSPLQVTISSLDSPWVPPFGAPALSDLSVSSARGLRHTTVPLAVAKSSASFDRPRNADSTLPALPPGQYRFLVHKFDTASPALMAIEPTQGRMLVLLPESKAWAELEPAGEGGESLAPAGANLRGWRMEAVHASHRLTLYMPTERGLAAVRPTLIGLSYTVAYDGSGAALGGPVAWAVDVCLPVLGAEGGVDLAGRRRTRRGPLVLRSGAPVPRIGFEAPVFDSLQVIWPSEEGQLVMRLNPNGERRAEWVPWPKESSPAFEFGCPYVSQSGAFWQLCRTADGESFEYVQMGQAIPQRVAVKVPRLGTGLVSYLNAQRIDGDPWTDAGAGAGASDASDDASTEIVLPLIESKFERAVVGLRIDAPQGVAALLDSGDQQHHAVLQVQPEHGPAMPFGALDVARPWLASVFVYQAHLWVYHPELPQVPGWKLES